jgi:hypothetical protein
MDWQRKEEEKQVDGGEKSSTAVQCRISRYLRHHLSSLMAAQGCAPWPSSCSLFRPLLKNPSPSPYVAVSADDRMPGTSVRMVRLSSNQEDRECTCAP